METNYRLDEQAKQWRNSAWSLLLKQAYTEMHNSIIVVDTGSICLPFQFIFELYHKLLSAQDLAS